ncbi:MAG: TadE/TadG family type IV pilus assembly protein [Paracoccaceae bacterium]
MTTDKTLWLGETRAETAMARFQKNDDGSFTIFGLFIFLLLIMIAGLGIDLMRYEHQRVGVQNTLDTAVVAATRLNQEADTNAEVTALVKDYFVKAGYDPDIVQVAPNIEIPAGGDEETLRTVTARVDFAMDTAFMNMLGIDELPGIVGGGAREGQQLIEIAMVLDISGSMGWGTKLDDMQEAAKSFVSMVLQNNGEDRVMISIVPYNAQVHISEDLANRLDNNTPGRLQWINSLTAIDPVPTHPGAIAQYEAYNSAARCARFLDADFDTTELAANRTLNPSAKFSHRNHNFNRPPEWSYWCGGADLADGGYPEMLLYQNDETKIHTFIDSLEAGGWTAIDYGMKWGMGVLDPSFRPIVQDMLTDSNTERNDAQLFADNNGTPYLAPTQAWIVPETVAGHPVNYGTPNVLKYIVLMTDGANTNHLDLRPEFKSGPTRIWYSDEMAEATGNDAWDGYMVEMPDNTADQRWYIPGNPNNTGDDEYRSETWFAGLDPDRVEQWSYHRLYERFSVPNAAQYFFQNSDTDAFNAHSGAIEDSGGFDTADARLARICDEAQDAVGVEVFTVAFEAPQGGVDALTRCSEKDPGKFFLAAGDQLTAAFEAIAAEITKLRLTQ